MFFSAIFSSWCFGDAFCFSKDLRCGRTGRLKLMIDEGEVVNGVILTVE